MASRPDLGAIAGLRWRRNWRIANGGQSFVVPFPTRRSFNVVFHGSLPFSYGHFGVHLGQEDRLTFLGSPASMITARFRDLRQDSPTCGQSLDVRFAPTSEYELRIPPGVAHDFDGLEDVNTLNNYAIYLPDPAQWAAGAQAWDMDADIVNVPLTQAPGEAASLFRPNLLRASDVFYRLLAERQRASMARLTHSHPYTVDVHDASGERLKLKISERAQSGGEAGEEPIAPIEGLYWKQRPFVETGPASGIRPLTDRRPYYIVDHGCEHYAHDAFGIHLGQDDHLTFLGSETARVRVEFVDCRRGSPSLHARVQAEFSPSPSRTLVIPRGVAHRFEGLENVFTLNQGLSHLDGDGRYEPGNDVIDWPLHRQDFPVLTVNEQAAGEGFYDALVDAQQRLRAQGSALSTPMVLMVPDREGNQVRVAIRREG